VFRLPGVVDHRPTPRLGKPHAAVLVRHAATVEYLVVPRDLVAVIRLAVVSEELVSWKGASLVQQFSSTWNNAVRQIGVAGYTVVVMRHTRRRRLEVVFVIILHMQQTTQYV